MRSVILLICGLFYVSAAPSSNRVIGGWEAVRGQFGFQVSLRYKNFQHFCGGTILNPTTILTAAHCIYQNNINGGWVIAGTNQISAGGEAYTIKEAIYHEDYNPNNVLNDIAIIKTVTPITFHQYVRPAEIAAERTPDGDTVILSGWGATNSEGTTTPDWLQYVHMKKLNLETCAEIMKNEGPVQDTQVCTAPVVGEGACFGDSGGPLVDYSYQLVGVVSWGNFPCGSGNPDVFTRVAAYEDWIAKYL